MGQDKITELNDKIALLLEEINALEKEGQQISIHIQFNGGEDVESTKLQSITFRSL